MPAPAAPGPAAAAGGYPPAGYRPITEEFRDWDIVPVDPVGWNAAKFSNGGATIHVIGAPTVAELRAKLRQARARERGKAREQRIDPRCAPARIGI